MKVGREGGGRGPGRAETGRRWWAALACGALMAGAAGAAQSAGARAPGAAAQSGGDAASNLANSAAATAAAAQNLILDRMSARELQLWSRLRELTPRIETYLQNLRADPDLGDVPTADRYYLGRLRFHGAFQSETFLDDPPELWRQAIGPLDDLLLWPGRRVLDLGVYRNSFAGMLFPDGGKFDRKHYRFVYVRREFLGQVRCYVFDVAPLAVGAKGSFFGRVWIEDQDDVLVRFNGSFWQDRYQHPDLHFDSWRMNARPGLWVPTYVYAEESDLGYGLFRHARFQAQTRLWGYDLQYAGRQEELTTVTVEGAEAPAALVPTAALSPLESMRSWEQQAENNVLDRLERAGLLAPAGPADAVLETVVNNLLYSNQLSISPPVRCRILLTTPLESVAVGHTIVLSRGLIDSLPDEASLAAMLAHELAHISLGQRLDTRYAFADRMLFDDPDSFRLLDLKRTAAEEAKANTLAAQLLSHSPYQGQLAQAGLFLRELDARRTSEPHLFSPHLGNAWFSHDYLTRLRAVEAAAPPLQPAQVAQIAALPLGGRLIVDAWTGALTLQTPQALPLLSAREKVPLQITPLLPYLVRAAPAAPAAVSGGGTGAGGRGGGKGGGPQS